MSEKLFVVGNGFDLHHHIPSGYRDFGAYVQKTDPNVMGFITEYLFVDQDFWNCFEERLATFDSDNVIEYASNYLNSYGADDWSDADHHNFEYEIKQIVSGLSEKMRGHFADWVRGLPIPTSAGTSRVQCVDPAGQFLNFNYTNTLQSAYSVPDVNVLHIHGRALNQNAQIILGHGWQRSEKEILSNRVEEDTDTRVAGGYRLIDKYFEDTFKPTGKILQDNQSFFAGLADVSEVWVLGHSLSDVDADYFAEIVDRVGTARWTISFYQTADKERQQFSRFGVDPNLVRYAALASL